jgi:hypothetical protein
LQDPFRRKNQCSGDADCEPADDGGNRYWDDEPQGAEALSFQLSVEQKACAKRVQEGENEKGSIAREQSEEGADNPESDQWQSVHY